MTSFRGWNFAKLANAASCLTGRFIKGAWLQWPKLTERAALPKEFTLVGRGVTFGLSTGFD